MNFWQTILSNAFESDGSIEMGRKSVTLWGRSTLGIGVILAVLKERGTSPVRRIKLNKDVTAEAKSQRNDETPKQECCQDHNWYSSASAAAPSL